MLDYRGYARDGVLGDVSGMGARLRKKPLECYRNFLAETLWPFCWYCGRSASESPKHWYGPFLIERAHIVSSPRIEDRRVAVLFCSVCHRVSHGEQIYGFDLPAPTVGHMLWLKRVFDREFYDLEFMRQFSIGNLPACLVPPVSVMAEFSSRHGSYPK